MLNASMHQVARLAGVMQVFLPHAAHRLRDDKLVFSGLDALASKDKLLDLDHSISTFGLLFEKIDDLDCQSKTTTSKYSKSNPNAMPQKDEITYDAFQTMDLRVGKF